MKEPYTYYIASFNTRNKTSNFIKTKENKFDAPHTL